MHIFMAKSDLRQRFDFCLPIQSLPFVQPLSEENYYV